MQPPDVTLYLEQNATFLGQLPVASSERTLLATSDLPGDAMTIQDTL